MDFTVLFRDFNELFFVRVGEEMGDGMLRTTLSCRSTNDSCGNGVLVANKPRCDCFSCAREVEVRDDGDEVVDLCHADFEEDATEDLDDFLPSGECRVIAGGEGGKVATIMS